MRNLALVGVVFVCANVFAQAPEYNPMKEMQTVEGYARITVQGSMRTWLSTRAGNGVHFYIDGASMGFTTRDEPAFTQEVPEGNYLIEACMGLWKPEDRKGGCVTVNLDAKPNTLYNIYHEVYLPPQLGMFPTPPEQKILGVQEVKF